MRVGDFVTSYAEADRIFRTPVQRTWFAGLLVLLGAFPFLAGDYLLYLACVLAIHLIATVGLNITTGFTGLISLGQAAFIGVGAYTAAFCANLGLPVLVSLPAGALAAALVGLAVGVPSLRIKGLYLAVATLAAQFLLGFVFREWEPATGGIRGTNVPPADLFGLSFEGDRAMYWLIVPLAVLTTLAARNLLRTRVGRAFVAVRDRDLSAEVLGIDLFRTKLASFAIGAAYAGLAGGLWAYFFRAITPESFTLQLSIFYLAAIIVGGLGSILGSVLGAAFMTLIPEVLRGAVALVAPVYPQAAVLVAPLREVVFGVLIIAFLILEPHGLAEIWRRIRRFFFLWPFRT
jgi:branched-chain amino acid transport system permease protein